MSLRFVIAAFCALLFFAIAASANAAEALAPDSNGTPFRLNIGVDGGGEPQDVDVAIKILFVITLLTLAPSIILLMTCFTRIVIVLSFLRTALSLQSAPSNQIIIGLSLFLSFFIMAPTWERINAEALAPYQAKEIGGGEALERAAHPIRSFMLQQTRPRDLELFVGMAKIGPTPPSDLPLKVVIPGFIVSELRTAFQMGFLVLMSMGMMMMPPMTISLPLKILLFVLVDGWELVVRSVVRSFPEGGGVPL
jgi:flagellar biosynthesis protein FliP